MKYLAMALVVALAAGALFLPGPQPPTTPEPPVMLAPTFAVCPVEEGGGRSTQLTAISPDAGEVQLTLFASGAPAGSIGVTIGPAGSTVIPIVDVAAVGTVGGLVELPAASAGVGSVVRGPESLLMESCVSGASSQTVLTGGTTADERRFTVQLMNPFAGEAVVDLTVSSEVGVESSDEFDSLIVPAMSSVIIDLFQLLPGRARLSVRVDTTSGRAYAVGRQGGSTDSAMWSGREAATDWLIPVPSGERPTRVLVVNPSEQEIDYQIDVYGSGGVDEAVIAESIPPAGEVAIDLTTLVEGSTVQGVRVISSSPVVSTLWVEDATSLSVTTGSATPANNWLLPGAVAGGGGESPRLVLLNPGLEDASVVIRSVRVGGVELTQTVPAQSVVELVLEAADGFQVEASVPVVALLATTGQAATSLSMGAPVIDG
jgi:hypothetical protein